MNQSPLSFFWVGTEDLDQDRIVDHPPRGQLGRWQKLRPSQRPQADAAGAYLIATSDPRFFVGTVLRGAVLRI
jgi:hypothetical protein